MADVYLGILGILGTLGILGVLIDCCLQAATGVYNFSGASIVSKNDLQLAREWRYHTVSTKRKCSLPG